MLFEKINQDLKTAFKKGDDFYVGVLRMMVAAFKNKEIEKRGKGGRPELSDEEIIEILSKEMKKRKEAANIYARAGRKDLSDKELKEVSIIQDYLPAQASFEEIEKIIDGIINKTGAVIQKDSKESRGSENNGANFGRIMGEAMKELKGKAESVLIAELIKKKLGQ